MDDLTRDAVTAYLDLMRTLNAVVIDPDDMTIDLNGAAWAANRAMAKAGVLDMPFDRWIVLVRDTITETGQ